MLAKKKLNALLLFVLFTQVYGCGGGGGSDTKGSNNDDSPQTTRGDVNVTLLNWNDGDTHWNVSNWN